MAPPLFSRPLGFQFEINRLHGGSDVPGERRLVGTRVLDWNVLAERAAGVRARLHFELGGIVLGGIDALRIDRVTVLPNPLRDHDFVATRNRWHTVAS